MNTRLIEQHGNKKMFKIKPDFLIKGESEENIILDAKWKVINEKNVDKNYGISQSDMYQLYAYGKKYFANDEPGKVFLIYPQSVTFSKALPVFKFDENLELWVVPFMWSDGKDDRVDFGQNQNNSWQFLANNPINAVHEF